MKKIPIPSAESTAVKTSVNTPSASVSTTDSNDDMRIAWRYNALPTFNETSAEDRVSFGHFFDLTKQIDKEHLDELNIAYFDGKKLPSADQGKTIFQNSVYSDLLTSIKSQLVAIKATALEDAVQANSLLRICITSLGSPLWYDQEFSQDVCLFLTILKALVRHHSAVCCVTMPMHLFQHYVYYTLK